MSLANGGGMFRFAVEAMSNLGREVIQDAGFDVDAIDWWIPHQANSRIIEACRRQLKIPQQKTLSTLARYGNSSAATIPLTLDYFLREPNCKIRAGDLVLLTCAAAGATSAAVLLRW